MKFTEIAKRLNGTDARVARGNDPVQWAMESHDVARDVIFPELADLQGDPITLPGNYCEVNWPVAAAQLKVAGIRLAFLLNRTLENR